MTAAGEPCDPENLKRWETERRLPTAVWHDAIAAVYGLDLEDIKTAIAASRQHRRGQGKETSVDRRRFIGAAAAAAGVAALPGIAQAREGIDGALTGAGGGDIDYLASAFERHRGGYRGRSPHEFLQEMHGDITLLKAVMQQPHPTRSRSELVHIAAGLAGLVAIIQHDRGDEADAHRWFHTAERAARECGDRRMTAWVLARHAMVPLNYGAPEQAARLAAQARRVAGKAPTGAGALAAAVTARALAAVGDQAGARQAVSDVRGLAERLTGKEAADTWFGYPLQKHHVHLSQAYTLLGDTPAAFQAQDDALDLTDSPSVMTRALIAMDTAACLRADGDPGAAADMAAAVLDRLPESYRHGLVRSRVELLHHRLDGRPRAVLGDALGT
ncbi:transcriptional regulator [Streptomyces showdoensis]|uniref:Transcriptional regulator n=2 Tax=Streptomyces showdoensis TaxID=68268 RepID=A0A2P2GKW7_STREW|nr:transcriptional regulator [Streptomyces showdoensis]